MSNAAEKQPEPNLPAATVMTWYQTTLSAIGDAVLTTDPEGRITYMNPVAERLTGWVAAESHGRPLEEVLRLVSEETRQVVVQPVRKVIETGRVRGMANHTLLIGRDGSERPIDDSAAPVRDEAGDLVGIVMVFRDISEQREKEREVRDALTYAESIVDTVRDPLLVLDADLRVRSASRSFYEDFGVEPGETEGRLVYELGDGQWDIPELRTLLEAILPEEGSFRDFEVTHHFEGSGRRRMLLNARKVRKPGNHSELILLAIEDVTPTWRAGVDFADNRERYRVIVEGAVGFAIFTFDTDGVITSWNAGAREMLGYTEEQILGENFRIIFTPEDLRDQKADWEMRTAAAEGRALDERWHLKKGGEPFYAQGLVMPLKDDADEIRGYLKIIRDKTEERQLRNTLQKRTDELEEADLHKNEFLAMLAHELRNPLAAITSAVRLARRIRVEDDDLPQAHEVIERQAGNLSRMIDDLLDVSRITQGKVELKREVVDVPALVGRATEGVRPLIEQRRHELTVQLAGGPLHVDADPTRLEQVVGNLLTNAAKYTEEGGTITVSARKQGGEVVIAVEDTGVGIPEGMLPKVFDLFTQVDRSLARSEGGLGIGLSLVRRLVDMHGGTVAAASKVGHGSTFTVRLPLVEAAAEKSEPSRAAEVSGAGRRVLIVDDNVDTARMTGRLLKSLGFEVRLCHDGSTGIEEAREFGPAVVLLDIGLPGLNGFEVAQTLREEACCGDSLIIGISGYGDQQAREKARVAGFDLYLVKPVDMEAVTQLVSQHLFP
jgi:PAS domain S-box-containing protein